MFTERKDITANAIKNLTNVLCVHLMLLILCTVLAIIFILQHMRTTELRVSHKP